MTRRRPKTPKPPRRQRTARSIRLVPLLLLVALAGAVAAIGQEAALSVRRAYAMSIPRPIALATVQRIPCPAVPEPPICPGTAVPLPQHKPVEWHDPKTTKLNKAEADLVDDRSATEARELGKQLIARFCARHPWADACKPGNGVK